MNHRWCVLAAKKWEAQPTLNVLDQVNIDYHFIELGIGPLHAQRTAAQMPMYSKILFLGSCGEFTNHEFISPRLITTNILYWSPPSVRSKQSSLIADEYPAISLHNICDWNRCLESMPVFTSPAITLDADLIPQELSQGIYATGVENMEIYSVCNALLMSEKLVIVLAITNGIGVNARKQWMQHNRAAYQMIAQWVAKYAPLHMK